MEYEEIIKKDKLYSESEIYEINSKIYDLFSRAEDSLNLVAKFLLEKINNKIVLDFGCGTGKFIRWIAPLSKSYIGVDISSSQLKLAEEKARDYGNVELLKNSGDIIPLESKTVDVIFSAWVIGSIHDLELRKNIIKEMERVVKDGGSIYLIENDIGGDYKRIVEEEYGEEKTKLKLRWLEENGFKSVDSFETFFEFDDLRSAKKVFGELFGQEVGDKVINKRISHNVTIYKK